MAHITLYAIYYKCEFVGTPQPTIEKAKQERERLAKDDGYPIDKLAIVEIPA